MKSVCRIVGISPVLLRTWESRYKLVEPTRAANNYRHYSEQDVRVLLRAKQLVDDGTAIGEVALVGRKRLLQDAPPLPLEGTSAADGTRPPFDPSSITPLAQAARVLGAGNAHQAITEALLEVTGSCFARIWVADSDPRYLKLVSSAGLSRRIADSPRSRIDLQSYPYMVGWVARTQQRIVKTGLEHDPRFDPVWVVSERIAASIVLPIERDRRLVGVLAAFFRQPITRTTIRELEAFGAMASVAMSLGDDTDLHDSARGLSSPVPEPSHAPRGHRSVSVSRNRSRDHSQRTSDRTLRR